jgi:hypothetical protein
MIILSIFYYCLGVLKLAMVLTVVNKIGFWNIYKAFSKLGKILMLESLIFCLNFLDRSAYVLSYLCRRKKAAALLVRHIVELLQMGLISVPRP